MFTSLEQIESNQIELENGKVETSSGKSSIAVGTWSASFSLKIVYYIPSLRINLMSCSRLKEQGATTSMKKAHCVLYHSVGHNGSLRRV